MVRVGFREVGASSATQGRVGHTVCVSIRPHTTHRNGQSFSWDGRSARLTTAVHP